MELDFFLLLPFTIAAVWIVAFLNNRRYSMPYDRVMLALLCCCALTFYIMMRSLSEGTGDYLYIIFDNMENMLGLSICPLMFMYIRMVARDSHWHRWYCLLFLPAMIIGLAGTVLSIAVGWDRILDVRGDNYAPFLPEPNSQIESLYRLVNITLFNITLQIMAMVLIGWSIFYLRRYYKRIGNYYADLEDSSVGRMHGFLISTILLLLTIFVITAFITKIEQGSGLLIAISAWLSMISWNIGHKSYNMKLTARHIDVIDDEDIPEEIELTETEDVIAQKISKWQSNELKPYCREGIKTNEVAREMNINPRELSVYINKQYGMNFNRWINTLRVEEAKRLLSNSDDIKISYVSAVCGFSDPGSLSKAFRMIEGCSPKEFKAKEE